jgi:hypothetical protein
LSREAEEESLANELAADQAWADEPPEQVEEEGSSAKHATEPSD